MKTVRLVGKLFGISLLILGFNSSCKKDKDDGDCITCTYTYGAHSYSYTYCENKPEEWSDWADSWQEVVEYAQYIDAAYDFITCN